MCIPLQPIAIRENIFGDNIAKAEYYDFSRGNLDDEHRILNITQVASICYQSPKAIGSESLYNRLLAESHSLLFYSLKDVLYNTDTTYVYCNFNLENTDEVLKEMLDTKVICKDGIYHSFSTNDWNNIENYFMFNTYEIELTLQFIKEKLVGDAELKVFIDVDKDKNITLVNGLIEDLFFDINNVTFYFKDNGTEA